MKTLIEQLLDAFEKKDWSLGDLLDRSGLTCDVTSLGRKLHGKQKTSTKECELLADALDASLSWSPPPRRRGRA